MADDLLQVLTHFYREVVTPDLDRREEGYAKAEQIRDVLGHLDELYRRFDRLETEYVAITAALSRLEKLTADLQEKDVRQELDVLKARVADLQERIAVLEASL